MQSIPALGLPESFLGRDMVSVSQVGIILRFPLLRRSLCHGQIARVVKPAVILDWSGSFSALLHGDFRNGQLVAVLEVGQVVDWLVRRRGRERECNARDGDDEECSELHVGQGV